LKSYLFILILFAFSKSFTQVPINEIDSTQALKDYISKTYVYLGNTFAEKHNGIIDSTNYTFIEVYKQGKIQSQFYPKFAGNSKKLITFNYYPSGELKSKISKIDYGSGGNKIDSIVYKIINSQSSEICAYYYLEEPQKEIQRKLNDTLFTDFYKGENIAYTHREFWESENVKQSCQVYPINTQQVNKYTYDESGELTQMDRYQNGEKIETSLHIDIDYDKFDRVIKRVHWAGEEKMPSYIEFIIFE